MTECSHLAILAAPPDRVFRAISDHERLSEWLLPGARVTLIADGEPTRDGLGAIRAIANGPLVGHETVVAYDAPRHLHYSVTRGLPLREHLARITLAPSPDGGTRLTWQVAFATSIPGIAWLIRAMIDRTLSKGLARLPAHLERLRAEDAGG